ncbi:DUF4192 domain-containing protein [Rhodococcus sp. NPDC003318]|uniref:DUF4192 domain-containing protein n=1 Tax=Rhodococcus sp. NPDC003318 TaxID=3364503 RepID=UPI00369F9C1A
MATMYPDIPNGRVHISDPADLIAAVPAMLGFTPHRSLVLICIGGTPSTVQTVMRHDLPEPGAVHDEGALERLAMLCEHADARLAVAVVVDERAIAGDPVHGTHHALAEYLSVVLADVGVALVGAHAVTAVVAGAQWWSLLGDDRHGSLPDPTASKVAAAQVFQGRPIRGSRGELEQLLAPRARGHRDRVARLLAVARHPASGARSRSGGAALDEVLAHIVDSAGHLADEAIVAVSLALEDSDIRDSVLGLAVTEMADAAEAAWIAMVRSLTGQARAEPAALLGFSAYARGDGPLAGVALAVALAADPEHRLAGLLDDALQHGIRPDVIEDLAHTGRDVAKALGVTLPPAACA